MLLVAVGAVPICFKGRKAKGRGGEGGGGGEGEGKAKQKNIEGMGIYHRAGYRSKIGKKQELL